MRSLLLAILLAGQFVTPGTPTAGGGTGSGLPLPPAPILPTPAPLPPVTMDVSEGLTLEQGPYPLGGFYVSGRMAPTWALTCYTETWALGTLGTITTQHRCLETAKVLQYIQSQGH